MNSRIEKILKKCEDVSSLVHVSGDEFKEIIEILKAEIDATSGGVTTYAALADKVTVDLPTINTPLSTALGTKQETLVSATNIKTVNGSSILGSGDLVVSGSGWALTGTSTLTGNVTIDQATNTVSFMNGNVGIGTATPANPLDVVGNVNVVDGNVTCNQSLIADYIIPNSGSALHISNVGDTASLNFGSSDDFELATTNLSILGTESTGIIGITAPNGVTTSAGLTVGTTIFSDNYQGKTAGGDLTIGQGENITIDNTNTRIGINATLLRMNGADTYTGTVAGAAGKSVVNGLIMD